MTASKNASQVSGEIGIVPADIKCGIIMPIAAFDGCEKEHWAEVKLIIEESVKSLGFSPNLVSDSADVGIIQKRIIENLYDNPVVVCDVSGRNPNVMFELGLRLAFDKPTIIIKDDKTPYSFDTSPIEHLEYPRDLRFPKMVAFKAALAEKVKNTYERSQKDESYTTFLKHFGTFKVAKLDKEEVSADAFLMEEVRGLRMAVSQVTGMVSTLMNSRLSHVPIAGNLFPIPGGMIQGVPISNMTLEQIDKRVPPTVTEVKL